MIDYRLVRANRKTLALHITADAAVEVRAPLRAPKADIDRFVAEHAAWIEEHLAARIERNAVVAAFELNYGDKALFLGKEYPIAANPIVFGQNPDTISFRDGQFNVPPKLPPEDVKDALVQLYKALAKRILTRKVADFAAKMNVAPAGVKINSAKGRWGSCSNRNSLNFSWRLILADEEVVDYVVVHELAHIKEPNHSPRFWAEIAALIPDYDERKRRLNRLTERLAKEDWD